MQLELLRQLSKPWQPHAFQKKGIKFLLEHAAAALFWDPGLGKTSATLAALKFLKERGHVKKVLLIAPKRVCYSVWPAEADLWMDFHELRLALLHGKDREEQLASDADIYLINPDGLPWLMQTVKTKSAVLGKTAVSVDLKRWKQFGFDTLVVDELSMFKHPQTNRFKALKQVLHTFQRRWGLTGSPAANGLIDLFGECYILDEGKALGRYITHYRHRYFLPSYDGFGLVLREGADEEIYKQVRPLALRMAAEDYLEMPQLIENDIRLDLPPEAQRVHDQLEADLLARIDEKTVVAANAAVASMKCRQVANGGIYLDDQVRALVKLPKSGREWVDLHTVKTDALADLVDELQGEPLLVAFDFEHDLARIRARLGDVPFINGSVSGKRSDELVRLWNAGKLPILLGHPQAMAHGLNLQEAGHHVCWHSLTWNYDYYDQFVRRVLRQGNKSKRVFVHRLIARGTVDEAVLTALRSKRRGQDALFEALRSRPRKR